MLYFPQLTSLYGWATMAHAKSYPLDGEFPMQHWLFLTLAIVFEVAGTTAMKFSDGFSKWLPSILIFVFYGVSFTLLTLALKKIDVSVAYAIWSGVGTALIAVIGVLMFKDPMNAMKVISIALIILGVVGLNFSGAKH